MQWKCWVVPEFSVTRCFYPTRCPADGRNELVHRYNWQIELVKLVLFWKCYWKTPAFFFVHKGFFNNLQSIEIFYKTRETVVSLDCSALIELEHRDPAGESMSCLGMNWWALCRFENCQKSTNEISWIRLLKYSCMKWVTSNYRLMDF